MFEGRPEGGREGALGIAGKPSSAEVTAGKKPWSEEEERGAEEGTRAFKVTLRTLGISEGRGSRGGC